MTMDKEVLLRKDYSSKVHGIIKLSNGDKKMMESQMVRYATNFLKMNFKMSLDIPIQIDGRLTRAGGSFHYTGGSDGYAKLIKLSERYVACALHDKEDGIEAILDVLRHELVHYALFEQGGSYSDGDVEFESKLKELGISSSGATSEKKRLSATPNVWYKMVDVYVSQISGKTHRYNHTKKHQDWIGSRVAVEVIKYVF